MAALLPSVSPTVAASTVSGVVPKVFWIRMRSASPPWLRWLIMRTVWSRKGVAATSCCAFAQDVNQSRAPGRRPDLVSPAAFVDGAETARVAAVTVVTKAIKTRLARGDRARRAPVKGASIKDLPFRGEWEEIHSPSGPRPHARRARFMILPRSLRGSSGR